MSIQKRFLSVFLCFCLLLGSIRISTQRAEASPLVVGAAAVVAVVAFLGACGITFTLFNTDSDTFVDTVSSKMDEYAVAQGFADVAEWVAGCELARLGDTFLLNKLAVQKFAAFATWFKDNIGLTSGSTVRLSGYPVTYAYTDGTYYLAGYPVFVFNTTSAFGLDVSYEVPQVAGTYVPFSDFPDFYIVYTGSQYVFHFEDGSTYADYNSKVGFKIYFSPLSDSYDLSFCRSFYSSRWTSMYSISSKNSALSASLLSTFEAGLADTYTSSSVVSSAASTIFIPDASTMADDESLSINTGETPDGDDDTSTDVSKLVTAVLAALAAGTLLIGNSSVVDTPTEDVTIPGLIQTVIDGITSLPEAIANAIASIFIPSEGFLDTAVAEIAATFDDRMGLLTYPVSLLYRFCNQLLTLSDQEPILSWSAVSIKGTQLIAAGSYNFNSAVAESSAKNIHDIYLSVVDVILIFAFLDLCRRKLHSIWHN